MMVLILLSISSACIAILYDVYAVYDVYDDSRRYSNDSNTPISDIMKEMVPY